jgi:hypothetical protein
MYRYQEVDVEMAAPPPSEVLPTMDASLAAFFTPTMADAGFGSGSAPLGAGGLGGGGMDE